MTALEILKRLDESIESERKIKQYCVQLREMYLKDGELEKALKQQQEINVYTHSIANAIMLRCEIEKSLDDEAEQMAKELEKCLR